MGASHPRRHFSTILLCLSTERENKKKGEKREKLSRFSKFYASNSTRVVGVWSTLIWFRVCIKRLKSDLLKSVHECEGLLKRLWVYTDIYSYVELLDASRGADQQESRKAHKIDGFDWKTSPNIRAINWSTIHAWLKWTQNVCNQKANLDVVVVRALPGARRRNISSIRGLAWLPLSLPPSPPATNIPLRCISNLMEETNIIIQISLPYT